MKSKTLFILLVVALTTSACAQLWGTDFKKSYLSIKKDPEHETVGTLFVWEADTSAAVLFKDGGACMQTALAFKTVNIKAKVKLSDALLKLKSITDAPDNTPVTNKELAKITGSIEEAAHMLTTTTERTTFLNIGMFYICQIAANNSVDEEATNTLIKSLIKAASKITK